MPANATFTIEGSPAGILYRGPDGTVQVADGVAYSEPHRTLAFSGLTTVHARGVTFHTAQGGDWTISGDGEDYLAFAAGAVTLGPAFVAAIEAAGFARS